MDAPTPSPPTTALLSTTTTARAVLVVASHLIPLTTTQVLHSPMGAVSRCRATFSAPPHTSPSRLHAVRRCARQQTESCMPGAPTPSPTTTVARRALTTEVASCLAAPTPPRSSIVPPRRLTTARVSPDGGCSLTGDGPTSLKGGEAAVRERPAWEMKEVWQTMWRRTDPQNVVRFRSVQQCVAACRRPPSTSTPRPKFTHRVRASTQSAGAWTETTCSI